MSLRSVVLARVGELGNRGQGGAPDANPLFLELAAPELSLVLLHTP